MWCTESKSYINTQVLGDRTQASCNDLSSLLFSFGFRICSVSFVMKFALTPFVLGVISTVSATPIYQPWQNSAGASGSVGALYCKHPISLVTHTIANDHRCIVITNDPSGNYLVSANIAEDGSVVRRDTHHSTPKAVCKPTSL